MRLIRSQSADIWRNLAVEEWLLSDQAPPPPLLFLWQAGPAVVIGKNQNPWMECAPGRLEQLGIRLARRVSGGGTVYHDLGNLNYSFILRRDTYRRDAMFEIVRATVQRLEIPAVRMGRSGIGVAGRKVSGNAFCYRGSRVLHHGTLLVSADLAKLQQALTPPPIKIRTRAVPSERSPVMNLAELVPNLTVERVAGTLAEGLEPASADFVELASLMELEKKHGSPAWLYEATPPFEAKFLSWRVRVDKGRIASGNLAGCPFRSRDMSARLEGDSKERVLALGL